MPAKAELEEYEPKIWRRFQVMNDITVARLAYILMTLFEMKGSHLYKFEVNELDNLSASNGHIVFDIDKDNILDIVSSWNSRYGKNSGSDCRIITILLHFL